MDDQEDLHNERVKVIEDWHMNFKKGTDHDLWGQPVEASDAYQRLCTFIREELDPSTEFFTAEHKKILAKVVASLQLRIKALQHPSRLGGVSLDDMKKVEQSLLDVLDTSSDFPLEVSSLHITSPISPTNGIRDLVEEPQETEAADGVEADDNDVRPLAVGNYNHKGRGTLLPPPQPIANKRFLTLHVDKIGVKDVSQFIDCFITVSIKDSNNVDVSSCQNTPIATQKVDNHIHFNIDVYVQKAMEDLPLGYAIFFEFKHFKPKKNYISTKCWGFLESDEIKEGVCVIELYKKPTDFRRKKLHLVTTKPLYLHLKLTID